MFNPNQAQVNDQVSLKVKTFKGYIETTGYITKIRNHSNYIDYMVYVNFDKKIAVNFEKDIRDGICIRVTPEGINQSQYSPHSISA